MLYTTGVMMSIHPASTPPLLQAVIDQPGFAVAAAAARRQRDHLLQMRQAHLPAVSLAALNTAVEQLEHGLIVLEGAPGSGVSTLLAAFAVEQNCPLVLADEAGHEGALLLYSQIAAKSAVHLPICAPAANDPLMLEQVMQEYVAQHGKLLLIIDGPTQIGQPRTPQRLALPPRIPEGVVLIYGTTPNDRLPYPAQQTLRLPELFGEDQEWIAQLIAPTGLDERTHEAIVLAAHANPAYALLAAGMVRLGDVEITQLPGSLVELIAVWWEQLGPAARQMALIAGAAEYLPPGATDGHLPPDDFHRLNMLLARSADRKTRPRHSGLRRFLAQAHAEDLARTHVALARAALRDQRPSEASNGNAANLQQNYARHAVLASPDLHDELVARLESREWLASRARSRDWVIAARELAWAFSAAARQADARTMVRRAALAGTFASRARALPSDALVECLPIAIEQHGREGGLRRVTALVEQLPDGLDKAYLLRQIGEACFGLGMRAAAMRLLSRALDLEERPIARSWSDHHDQVQAALAMAAVQAGELEAALIIATRIEHAERRAQIETRIAHVFCTIGDLQRAQKVAREIHHDGMRAWACAEVAVMLERAHDPLGQMLLAELESDTARAWAEIELACDLVVRNAKAAIAKMKALPSQTQRDRGLARLAITLAMAGDDGEALTAAEQIQTVEVRVSALLDLRLTLDGLVANIALEQATADVARVSSDERFPLLAQLAAAHAALGRRARALAIVEQLSEGEERNRATARVAVAVARRGDFSQARGLLAMLVDDDERDWALDELAHLLSESGDWEAAIGVTIAIGGEEQRARTIADLAIIRARAGEALAAFELASQIRLDGERARALVAIAPLVIEQGRAANLLELLQHEASLATGEARSRYRSALASALAKVGQWRQAAGLIAGPMRPLDRSRAAAVLGLNLQDTPARATGALGVVLEAAVIGRDEAYRAIELAAPLLFRLGGSDLLEQVSHDLADVEKG